MSWTYYSDDTHRVRHSSIGHAVVVEYDTDEKWFHYHTWGPLRWWFTPERAMARAFKFMVRDRKREPKRCEVAGRLWDAAEVYIAMYGRPKHQTDLRRARTVLSGLNVQGCAPST